MRRGIAAAFASVVLLAAAPAPHTGPVHTSPIGPVPSGSQTALLRRYIDAIAARRYADAFALLDAAGRSYFRTPKNFASTFEADGFSLLSYTLTNSIGYDSNRAYNAREYVRLRDPAHDATGTATINESYNVTGTGPNARILDLGRPWKSYRVTASASAGGLRIMVKKVSYYAHRIAVVVTIANVGTNFVTLLPYGRSALRDELGSVYHPMPPREFRRMSDPFSFGTRLAANTQVTGAIEFNIPSGDAAGRTFSLTVAPNVREGGDAPFSVDVPKIEVPA